MAGRRVGQAGVVVCKYPPEAQEKEVKEEVVAEGQCPKPFSTKNIWLQESNKKKEKK